MCDNSNRAPVAQWIERSAPNREVASSILAGRIFKFFKNMLIVNRNESKIIETPHKSEIRPLIDRTTSPIENCSLAEEILPVGAAVAAHFHKQTEEIYYILSGAGEMRVGETVREVKSGDAIFIPRLAVHTLKNTGTEPIKLLLVCGAAHDFADYFPV